MTQIQTSQRGEITPEMQFAADREQLVKIKRGRETLTLT
jgi:thiamine biosynthesis protein ThiC